MPSSHTKPLVYSVNTGLVVGCLYCFLTVVVSHSSTYALFKIYRNQNRSEIYNLNKSFCTIRNYEDIFIENVFSVCPLYTNSVSKVTMNINNLDTSFGEGSRMCSTSMIPCTFFLMTALCICIFTDSVDR